MKRHYLNAALIAGLYAGTGTAAPILGTGWTEDIIIESSVTDVADIAAATGGGDGTFNNRVTVAQDGFTAMGPLPVPGLVISGSNIVTTQNGTEFFVDPTTDNAIDEAGGTLTLNTAGAYEDLQFLAVGINGNFTVTLNFDDASTTDLALSIPDWTNSNSDDAFATQLAYVVDGTTGARKFESKRAREYGFTLSPADQAKNIVSIDFSTSQRAAIIGISGTLVPEPGSLALFGLGGLLIARRRRSA